MVVLSSALRPRQPCRDSHRNSQHEPTLVRGARSDRAHQMGQCAHLNWSHTPGLRHQQKYWNELVDCQPIVYSWPFPPSVTHPLPRATTLRIGS